MGIFRLTLLAELDLAEIGTHTIERWGRDQAVSYLTRLDATFAALAQAPALGKDRSDLRPNLMSCPCNRHVIFFRRDVQGNAEILRILHDQMDFQRHL